MTAGTVGGRFDADLLLPANELRTYIGFQAGTSNHPSAIVT